MVSLGIPPRHRSCPVYRWPYRRLRRSQNEPGGCLPASNLRRLLLLASVHDLLLLGVPVLLIQPDQLRWYLRTQPPLRPRSSAASRNHDPVLRNLRPHHDSKLLHIWRRENVYVLASSPHRSHGSPFVSTASGALLEVSAVVRL